LVQVIGTARRRAQFATEVATALESLAIHLPEGAFLCGELEPRSWQTLGIGLPRVWQRNQREEMYDWDEWLGFDAMSRAKVRFQIHNDNKTRPEQRQGAQLARVGPATVGGRPATVYQRQSESGAASGVLRLYALDELVERKDNRGPHYLEFSFDYQPELDGAAIDVPEEAILASVHLPDDWFSTPAPPPTTAATAPAATPARPASAAPATTASAASAAQGGAAASEAQQQGAALQGSGDYLGALRAYRQSLAIQPDARLQDRVERLEAYLRLKGIALPTGP
jgi:hypothetical protein